MSLVLQTITMMQDLGQFLMGIFGLILAIILMLVLPIRIILGLVKWISKSLEEL